MSSLTETLDRHPVVEIFNIIGLHESKDIKFSASDSASILMARNGSGKTTLLAAINAVLTGNLYRLADFQFKTIEFKLQGTPLLYIHSDSIESFKKYTLESPAAKLASDCGVSLNYVLEVVQSIPEESTIHRYHAHPGIQDLIQRHPSASTSSVIDVLIQFKKGIYREAPELEDLLKQVFQVMAEFDIVYLPTYRRIEMSLTHFQSDNGNRAPWERSPRSRMNFIPSEIKFGLSDITERLQSIYQEIQRNSNTTYQKISANIINDLLDGSYTEQNLLGGRPDKNELELFFSRIRSSRMRPGAQKITIPDIDKIYRDDFDEGVRPFLLYFLSNLNEAIISTKPLEDRVNGFIEACNKYLSDEDATAYREKKAPVNRTDSKKININRDTFRPYFTTKNGENKIRIDALSSGEKQVVSLFARLYLYDKKKIILYDEPELSLSIGWQAQLLPDLCRSPDFRQIISITHSPFVFDNELDSYAGNLYVSPYTKAEPDREIGVNLDNIIDDSSEDDAFDQDTPPF